MRLNSKLEISLVILAFTLSSFALGLLLFASAKGMNVDKETIRWGIYSYLFSSLIAMFSLEYIRKLIAKANAPTIAQDKPDCHTFIGAMKHSVVIWFSRTGKYSLIWIFFPIAIGFFLGTYYYHRFNNIIPVTACFWFSLTFSFLSIFISLRKNLKVKRGDGSIRKK